MVKKRVVHLKLKKKHYSEVVEWLWDCFSIPSTILCKFSWFCSDVISVFVVSEGQLIWSFESCAGGLFFSIWLYMLATDFSSSAKFFTCLRMPFGSLWGFALHSVVDVDNCIIEDFTSLAGVTLTVRSIAGVNAHVVDGTDIEGGSNEGRGGDAGGRGGSEGRKGGGEVEQGGEGTESRRCGGRGGGLEGGRLDTAKGVRIWGLRGGEGRGGGGGGQEGGGGGEVFGGQGRFSKMSVLVSNVIKQVGVSLLRNSEFKMQGIEGESSKEQSAGDTTTLGSDLSPTVLETVGKVEREQWDQGEESEESEGRDCNCSVPFIVGDSLSPVSSFSVTSASSTVSKGLLLPLSFGLVPVLSFSAFCLLLCHCFRAMVSDLSGSSHIGFLGKQVGRFHILWIFSLGPLRNSFLACVLGKTDLTKSVLSKKSEFVDLWSVYSL